MHYEDMSRDQLMQEIAALHRRVSELESLETGRPQAENKLYRNRRFLSDLIEHSGALICVKDREGRYELINHKWEEVAGLKRHDTIARTDKELFPGPAGEQFRRNDLEVMESGSVLEKEEILEDGHGKRFFISIKFPLRNDEGMIRGVCAMITEITARKQMEEELGISRNRLSRAEIISRSGNWEFDLKSNRVFASDGARRIYGLQNSEWMIPEVQKIPLPEYRDMLDGALRGLIEENRAYDVVFKIRRPDTGEIIDIHAVAEYDSQRRVVFGILQDITELRRSEEVVREKEAMYRTIVENTNDAIYIHDFQGNIIDVNENACSMVGYTREELVGANLSKIDNAWQLPENPELGQLIGQGNLVFERQNMRRDGSIVPVEVSVKIVNHQGQGMVQGFVRDISERKYAEEQQFKYKDHLEQLVEARTEQLKRSEMKYRTLFESANDVILLMRQGTIIDCNSMTLEQLGCTREEVIGQAPQRFSPALQADGRDSAERVTTLMNATASGRPQRFEWQILRKDGTIFDAEVNLFNVEIGAETVIQGVAHNITARKQSEKILRESEEKFRLLFERSTDPTLLLDEGAIIDCNEITSRFLRGNREQIIGKQVTSLSPDRQPDGLLSADKSQDILNTAYKEGSQRFEWVHRTFDGEDVWVDISLTVIPIGGKQITYCVWRDMGERKKMSQALEQRENELRLKTITLEELNIALKVLLQQKMKDEKELEERFASNVTQLVLPYVERMKGSHLDAQASSCLSIIEANLNEIVSPFLHSIRQFSLTPRELQVASFIRNGKTTKEIAAIIGVAPSAVDGYRNSIRSKLQLNNKKINLQSHLQSIT